MKKWVKVLDISKTHWKLTPKIFKAFLYHQCPAVILIINQVKLNDSPLFKDFYLFESQLNAYAATLILVQGRIEQKQPSRGVPRKTCFENVQQIYRSTPMPNCDFNEVAKQLY